jgi:hypothetical protein
MKLSSGMMIRALIEARLFGKRLLTLEADVAVLPARSEAPGTEAIRLDGANGNGNGGSGPALLESTIDPATLPAGGAHRERLARAAKSLEQGAQELRRARDAMPRRSAERCRDFRLTMPRSPS